jgi:hypothetical protein
MGRAKLFEKDTLQTKYFKVITCPFKFPFE